MLQDAYILGRLLTLPSVHTQNLNLVLRIYDEIRRPIAHEAADRSLRISRVVMFFPEFLPEDVNLEKLRANDKDELRKVTKEIERIWSFSYIGDPEDDWVRAKDLYERYN